MLPEVDGIAFTPAEIGTLAKLSRATVYRLIASGELPAARIGGQYRVPASELERLLSPRRAEAEGAGSR